jgi:hypothetical protein
VNPDKVFEQGEEPVVLFQTKPERNAASGKEWWLSGRQLSI